MEKLKRSKFSYKIWRQKLKRKHRPHPHKKLNGRSDLRVTLSIFYSMWIFKTKLVRFLETIQICINTGSSWIIWWTMNALMSKRILLCILVRFFCTPPPPFFFSSEELTSQHVNLIGLLIGKLRPHVCQGHLYQIFVLSLGFSFDNVSLWTSGDISYNIRSVYSFLSRI